MLNVYPVSSLYGSLLWGRKFAVQLRDRIVMDKAEHVIVDFQGVTMVSRAYTDEFLNVVDLFKKRGVTVESKNLAPEVKKMFQFVQHRRSEIRSQKPKPPTSEC